MYHLQTACGREATLTGDHNLWVMRDGYLRLIRTADALSTDYVPLPERLLGESDLHTLDLREIVTGRRVVTVEGRQVFALSQNATMKLDCEMPLSPAVLKLFGYYIAEGCSQSGYLIIANRNPHIRGEIEAACQALGIRFSVRPSSDYQISSGALTDALHELCGGNAREKQLPPFWSQLSQVNLAHLLRAYFDGDGFVEHASAVCAMTASSQLASDLAYALLRFGIWAHISKRWKRATNTDHIGDWYYLITISGQADLRRFAEYIGFSLSYKMEALQRHFAAKEHSNVDIVPIKGADLRWLRITLGLTARQLGDLCGISRSGIQLFEAGKRKPRRKRLIALLNALRKVATEQGQVPERWQFIWEQMRYACNLRWTPIKSVTPAAYPYPYVYDLSVPEVENFLAGNGGFFVHNTYAVAQVVQQIQRPTLVLAHNKTLAAQLYAEFKEFFPRNAVEYFVSYYDYYQPEAYVPRLDLYIEKESDINDEIERLRLAATAALLTRQDVLIVASVSCIYGLVSPQTWAKVLLPLQVGQTIRRNDVLRHLVTILYERNDVDLKRGAFRVRGDTLEIMPSYLETAYRIAFFGDEIERIVHFDPMTGEILEEVTRIDIFPAKHYVAESDTVKAAIHDIEVELEERLAELEREGKLLEAQRLKQRTLFDLEMIREIGTCSGIENYSRHFDRRAPGTPPYTLLDYLPEDYLLVIDESHIAVPQVRGMYHGDRSRKVTLVDYGFRLPCAMDNRPLNFEEFEARMGQTIYTSATPGPYELEHSQQVVQQIIRPTGIVDPEISVRPIEGQVDNLLKEITIRTKRGERALVTTLTKRMAEDLAQYLTEMGVRVHYLHSEIDTLQRIEILRDLRLGVYDVVVGINLLREGLDLPEVSLVAILDADKEGFLRSEQALIQTIGRAARHVNGQVIMYADRMTDSMQRAIAETERRRAVQVAYNEQHGITPASIIKQVRDLTDRVKAQQAFDAKEDAAPTPTPQDMSRAELDKLIRELEKEMKQAAKDLAFEKAAALRDQVLELRKVLVLKADKNDLLAVGAAADVFEE